MNQPLQRSSQKITPKSNSYNNSINILREVNNAVLSPTVGNLLDVHQLVHEIDADKWNTGNAT